MSKLSPFGFLFGKGLNDLIRGIRRCQSEEQQTEFLLKAVAECREEVRSNNMEIKSTAVLKLAYLEMLGFDMKWSGFHVIEVMSSPDFQQKRIGYIAAMQSLMGDAEMLMLMTNLLKMDLVSRDIATVGIALSGLATVVSPLLAMDTADDIMRMLSHSNTYIRQKAVLALHNVVLEYPEVLSQALQRIADLLDRAQQDPGDPGNVSVVSATVSVICELSTHSASIDDFLELTPKLYSLFNTSQHNWTLIKLLKIFALFTKREPRLKSKLLPAIRDMMLQSEATSLIFESIQCIIHSRMLSADDYELAKQCTTQMDAHSDLKDANLVFLTAKLLAEMADINPGFLPQHSIIKLFIDVQPDPITHRQVLKLLKYCVNDDTIFELASTILSQFRDKSLPSGHKIDLAIALAEIVAVENYEYVPNFEWLIELFEEICEEVIPEPLSTRILDIVIRVRDQKIRNLLSELCWKWFNSQTQQGKMTFSGSNLEHKSVVDDRMRFVDICWWIIGEFPGPTILADPQKFVRDMIYHYENGIYISPPLVTCVAKLLTKTDDLNDRLLDSAIEFLTLLSYSMSFELHERSCQFLELLKLAKSSPEQSASLLRQGLASLFNSYEITPIAPGSQQKILIPDWLDLETPVLVSNVDDLQLPSDNNDSDVESSIDLDTNSDKTGSATIRSPIEPVENQEKANRQAVINQSTKESQLFNLTALETRQRERPAKKKVQIASDEVLNVDESQSPSIESLSLKNTSNLGNSSKKIFRSGFRTPTGLADADSSQDPAPVKVKHKKNSRSKLSNI